MKKNLLHSVILKYVVCLPLVLAGHTHALQPLSNSPLFLGGNISPNVMFTLDDSGSMQFEIMPGELIIQDVRYMFPRASGIYGESDYNNYVVGFNGSDFDSSNQYTASLRSSHVNKIYYNPAARYLPWSNADGSLMSDANPTCAPHNPMNTAKGCRNLTVNNRQNARWLKKNGSRTSSDTRTFYPAVYFQYNSGSVNSASSYTQVEIRPGSAYVGGANRLDCAAAPTCTYDEEIQNFANWYTYYRSRILLARAGIGRAFSAQGNTMRVGFAAINKGSSTIDSVSTGTVINGVRQFTGTNKANFFTNLYDHTIPAAGTPLRRALDEVGQYYMRDDEQGPWSETPGASGGTQLECRQNYNILMTDGYWSTGNIPAGIDNSDNESGATISNDSSPATPPTYTYTPTLPFSDSFDDTLADVAMHYWKTDLRTDMLNKVPTNSADPAFWQHMVNYTVGLGVNGTLNSDDPNTLIELQSGAQTWPDPTSGDLAKIDDLWHAAVNSRGGFFSAAEPATFADALTNTLTTIVSRTGSASAVAANSNALITNGRIYQAKFNSGDWVGHLLSIPINTTGTLGATEWNAGTVSLAPSTIAPSSRVVITKGSSGGVSFEYANLTTAQKALLDKNTAGTVDNCGLERVAYIRGDATNEGAGGTFSCASASNINKLRSRTSSKLGDIVNSGPFYVDRPNAGHFNVDHPGYGAFRTNFKDRTPVVYVGANDGKLHGFNACIAGVTPGCSAEDEGKELIAYIPSTIYANLNRTSDKDYNASHRYFVDGSPMVADALTGTSPSWKSVLVGGLNGGGKGYYALDITNPANFSAANAANLFLWEFTDTDDIDMGYSYNLPPINPFTSQASQIVKMENNQWAVIVGNGYNSTGGKAVLYVLFITGGEDGTWTIGTDYIKLVADAGTGNGLSTPRPFDADGNGLVDVIYAGDIKGNLWKFDVASTSPANWGMALSGAPLFVSGTSKPIISPPAVTFHPGGGQLVIFGTGKYLETADTTNTNTQTMYGIRDHSLTGSGSTTLGDLVGGLTGSGTLGDVVDGLLGSGSESEPVTLADLVEQVVSDTTVRTSTQNPVPYSDTIKGWYFNLPISGERLTGVPALEDGLYTFTTIIPSASPCDFGGRGFANTVDYLTGGMLSKPAFDINRNGVIALNDGLSAGVEIGFAVGGVTRIRGHLDDVLISSTADGSLVKTPATKGSVGMRGRITWRELTQ